MGNNATRISRHSVSLAQNYISPIYTDDTKNLEVENIEEIDKSKINTKNKKIIRQVFDDKEFITDAKMFGKINFIDKYCNCELQIINKQADNSYDVSVNVDVLRKSA